MTVASPDWDVKASSKNSLSPASPMPWGKHRGTPVNQIPQDYLIWALNNADHMAPDLRAAIQSVLGIAPEDGKKEAPENQEANNLRRAWEAAIAKCKAQERRIKDLQQQLARAGEREPLGDMDRFRAVVKQWFRAMSLIHHPDRGGSPESQAIVNSCYTDLTRRLEGESAR